MARRLGLLLVPMACLALSGSGSARAAPKLHLTIRVSPQPAVAGQVVTVNGGVVGAGARVRLILWRRFANQRSFRIANRTTTDGHGAYSFTVRPDAIQSWYVSAASGSRSRTVLERVRARVTLTSSDPLPTPGEKLRLSGSVSPSYARQPITLQMRTGGRWRTMTRTRLNLRSKYSVRVTFHSNQTPQLRAFLQGGARNGASYSPSVTLPVDSIHHIKHVVVIMQENRSFDQYFATYPGADGINPASPPCVPDPLTGGSQCAFADHSDRNSGGPHGLADMTTDMNCTDFAARTGCQMDGFVSAREQELNCAANPAFSLCSPCTSANVGQCNDVMGYHDGSDIPNYWKYAHDFVLQDHMFAPNASWSLPQHLFMVSEWSAYCTNPLDPFSCKNALETPYVDQVVDPSVGYSPNDGGLHYAWTDLTYLLYKAGVSWGYYVYTGTEPDCPTGSTTCAPVPQNATTPGIWNPLPSFTDVRQDGQLGNIQTISNFYAAAKGGTLPAVSWVNPTDKVSEHPTSLVSAGQRYVTGLINAIMQGPDWNSTAIFLSWDDWSGFYDNAVPPSIDENGLGMRVPGLVISPYAKRGYVDHQNLSHDDYNKFIEDDFLGRQRLDPKTDGRPDPRPDVRENIAPGNLTSDFDFGQTPRPPEVLPLCPQTALTPTPAC